MTKLLPTPAARDSRSGASNIMDRNSRPLNEVIETGMGLARLLPSPRATDGTNGGPNQRGSSGDLALPSAVHRLPLFRTPTSQLAVNGGSQHPDKRKAGGHGPTLADEVEHLLPTPAARLGDYTSRGADPARYKGPQSLNGRRSNLDDCIAAIQAGVPWVAARIAGEVVDWGPYARAVLRWAQVTGTLPPHPVEPGKTGMRLSPAFVEWLMGLPEGWVTGVPGLSRNAQLKALGNGCVPQQVMIALSLLLSRMPVEAAS